MGARQQLRTEEIAAIQQAVDIITGQVAGHAAKHLAPATEAGSVLAQLRRTATSEPKDRAIDFLEKRAQALGSSVLSVLALKASSDPFVKVRKMIKDLVARLMEEANEEASQKKWCDDELKTNEVTRNEKTKSAEALSAAIDGLNAAVAETQYDMMDLDKSIVK